MGFIITMAIIIAISFAFILIRDLYKEDDAFSNGAPKLSDEIEKEYRDMYTRKSYCVIYPSKPKLTREQLKAELKSKTV